MSIDEKQLNKMIFSIYNGVLKMDYTKNSKLTIIEKIKKIYRYVRSGYIFDLKQTRDKMNQMNVFEATNKEYSNIKIAIYTVSTGKYDEVLDPIYIDNNIDYFVFTDSVISNDSIWKKMNIPQNIKNMTSLAKARYLKTHPHLFFKDYDYSIFIDGNIRITCDIKPLIYSMIESGSIIAIHRHQARDCIYSEGKAIYAAGKAKLRDINEQLTIYRNEGFPAHFGLFETNVLIRKHNEDDCINIMNCWWEQMDKHTKRDQLSFTYSLWKNGRTADYVFSLGNNSRRNPYFIVDAHN